MSESWCIHGILGVLFFLSCSTERVVPQRALVCLFGKQIPLMNNTLTFSCFSISGSIRTNVFILLRSVPFSILNSSAHKSQCVLAEIDQLCPGHYSNQDCIKILLFSLKGKLIVFKNQMKLSKTSNIKSQYLNLVS